MNFPQTLDYLYSSLPMYQQIGKSAYKNNLKNTLTLCSALGNPQDQFKSIHIAGTNGKGSSAHMIAAILQSAGYRTGLYTSPHLKNFTERIRINGREINERSVINFVNDHKALIEEVHPSFFEITVVMAFDYFRKQDVDIAVIEVGLGGRLDSTNVITPAVSLITNISLDHQDMLGETIELIAVEKAGIIKKETPIVIGKKQPETVEVFKRMAMEVNAPIIFAEEKHPIDQNNYHLQLKGDYQEENVPGVLSVIDQLVSIKYEVTKEHIRKGLSNTIDLTGIKGRWQTVQEKPLVICDTGHNIDGVQAVVSQISRTPHNRLHIIWGMVNDKDSESILKLLPKNAKYYFCRANIPRAKDAHLLLKEAKKTGLHGDVIENVNRAIEVAKKQANFDDLILIGGSTFVVAEIADL